MTPPNPSPDTGAGTPLTAEEEADLREMVADPDPGLWAPSHRNDVARLLAALDAARSRPDPAGLDAETIERSLLNIRWLQKFIHLDPPIRRKLAHDLAAEYARLSVADGVKGRQG